MSKLKILHLEDSAQDAELVEAALAADGLDCVITLAEDEGSFRSQLKGGVRIPMKERSAF